ncbi:hypothetical protein ECZU51_20600 [Escherichia coli]|nr:hypothetical protein ECZU51_20600 [Escherichia coli]
MSKLLDRFRYFKQKGETFADGHGQVMHSNRDWEDSYRQRWQFDKIVRSTHGVNCTGSCSWKIYVKNGLVTWEIQQTDYPRTRPDLPNHEPRGCPRGASYSWYLYSANRLKYPLIRKRLIELWREALKQHSDPVLAWASIMNDPQKCLSYKQVRGRGGFIRSNWQELNQLIAAANVWTIKTYGPDRVAGFSPIPAMSMVSYAAGTRYLSLLGGTCLSFYDWYCDLPPASPMTGVSKPTCQNLPTGITPVTSSPGGLTYRRHVRRTPISLPKYATKALKPSQLPLTTLKWPNCATSGWHQNKALIAPWRWQWAM